jgi:predicted GNAT family acetyltransferase
VEVVTYSSAGAFLRDTQAWLERSEAENALILGLAQALGAARDLPTEPFLASVRDRDALSLAALMTPPYPLAIAESPGDTAPSLAALADHLHAAGHKVSGVVAAPDTAAAFSAEWKRVSGHEVRSTVRQRMYRLTAVRENLRKHEGRLRRATHADLELVGEWIAAFSNEALNDADHERARRLATTRVERGELYLWEDSEPRGMVGRARPTRNTIAVNAVYTPPAWRNQGIASAAVAALSTELLREGYSMCVLYTDLANPTSNSIYQRIGYEPVGDSVHLEFG